jgi:hypothetical protein
MARTSLIPLILLGVVAAASLGVTLGFWPVVSLNWGLVSTLVLLVFLGLLMWESGRRPVNTMVISVTATLAALASLGRIVFAAVASVQPATFLVLLSGYVFGSRTGFVVGTMTGLISNFFVGHGPWTLWQMMAWGICGLLGGVLGKGKSQLTLMPFLVMSPGSRERKSILINRGWIRPSSCHCCENSFLSVIGRPAMFSFIGVCSADDIHWQEPVPVTYQVIKESPPENNGKDYVAKCMQSIKYKTAGPNSNQGLPIQGVN